MFILFYLMWIVDEQNPKHAEVRFQDPDTFLKTNMDSEMKKSLAFHYIGCLIGILTLIYYIIPT